MKNRKRPVRSCDACQGEAQVAVRAHNKPCIKLVGQEDCLCPIVIVDCETCYGSGRMIIKRQD